MDSSNMSYEGKIIYSRDRDFRGVVRKESERYCATCGRLCACYIVDWDDGTTTKPCARGVQYNEDGTLEIS